VLECVSFINPKGDGRGNGGRGTGGRRGIGLAACIEEGGAGGEPATLGEAAVGDVVMALEMFCLEEGDGLGGSELG
jgi:hypothetical protein